MRSMLTGRGPEALRGLDKNILEDASETVPKQLRADEGEDSNTWVLRIERYMSAWDAGNNMRVIYHLVVVIEILHRDDLNGNS